jgi:hypothetical protein
MNFTAMTIDPGIFAQYGVIGLMLWWFAFRLEKRLDRHSEIVNALSRSILLDVLSRDNLSERVRLEANTLLDQVQLRKE